MLKKLLISFSLLLLSAQAWGANWYVKPASSCSNNGDGTSSACAASGGAAGAWKGSANIVWASVSAGDTINIGGSWVASDCHDAAQYCFLVGKAGSVGNPIILEFSGSSFNGGGARTKGIETSTFANLRINNFTASNFTTYGIAINSSGASTDAINVYVEAPTITDISGCAGQCNGIFGKGSGITVHNPRVKNIADDGIWTDGDNAQYLFDTNDGTYYVSNVGTGAAITGDCFQFSGSAGTDTNIVQKGYCDHRSVSEKQCIVTNSLGLLTVTDTICLAATYTVDAGSICIFAEGRADVRRTVCDGWSYGIDIATKATSSTGNSYIIGNIVRAFGTYGLTTGSATPTGVTVTVANNTIDGYGSDLSVSRCLNLAGAGSSVVNASNNISANCKFGFVSAGGTGTKTLTTNADFGNTTRYSGFASGSTNANPLWVGGQYPTTYSGYRLSSGSTIRRAGTELNIGNVQDYGNRAFQHPPSIGAWEVTSGDSASSRTTASTRTVRN